MHASARIGLAELKQFAIARRPRFARFDRRAFHFADGDHLSGVRFRQLAPANEPAALANLGQIFTNFILDCCHYGRQQTYFVLRFGVKKVIRGSCLCGGVRFEVDPSFIRASHCHCDRCRKHSGTAVCTQARVRKEQFRLLQGEELVKVYGKGEGAVKAFCVNCGSSLFGGDWPEGPQVSIRMGAFDDDPGIRPQFHTYVDCRAPWDEITDELPQYREGRTDD
jgi:hypothetical protein